MKNRYESQGDITVVYLDRRDGSVIPAVVSTSRLPELLAFPCKWVAAWRESTQAFYVMATVKGKTVYLHRFLNKPRRNEDVDHRDNDPLNNTDDNLRNVHRKTNNKNRRFGMSKQEKEYYERLQERAVM